MIKSNAIFLQLAIVVVLMITLMAAEKMPQTLESMADSSNNKVCLHICNTLLYLVVFSCYQQRPTSFPTHHEPIEDFKQVVLIDDEDLSPNNSDEEYNDYHHEAFQKSSSKTRSYSTNNIPPHGNDNRVWVIPYRFGKRAAMPYRFGKRAAGMHFRLGKKSTSL